MRIKLQVLERDNQTIDFDTVENLVVENITVRVVAEGRSYEAMNVSFRTQGSDQEFAPIHKIEILPDAE